MTVHKPATLRDGDGTLTVTRDGQSAVLEASPQKKSTQFPRLSFCPALRPKSYVHHKTTPNSARPTVSARKDDITSRGFEHARRQKSVSGITAT